MIDAEIPVVSLMMNGGTFVDGCAALDSQR